MDPEQTALVLIGFQNDYFASDGVLCNVIEKRAQLIANAVELVEELSKLPILIVATPVLFTPDYGELVEPVGILKTIKEVGAFKAGTKGAETIVEVPGKRGLNAFSNTDLDQLFKARAITNVVLAGVATSICIDSTGRSAYERDYKVFILSDCTAGRTSFEQEFYCEKIFPLYAQVIDHAELVNRLSSAR
jgi:nicotinamidase-related amidase